MDRADTTRAGNGFFPVGFETLRRLSISWHGHGFYYLRGLALSAASVSNDEPARASTLPF
jgi:hypothetical protein